MHVGSDDIFQYIFMYIHVFLNAYKFVFVCGLIYVEVYIVNAFTQMAFRGKKCEYLSKLYLKKFVFFFFNANLKNADIKSPVIMETILNCLFSTIFRKNVLCYPNKR